MVASTACLLLGNCLLLGKGTNKTRQNKLDYKQTNKKKQENKQKHKLQMFTQQGDCGRLFELEFNFQLKEAQSYTLNHMYVYSLVPRLAWVQG